MCEECYTFLLITIHEPITTTPHTYFPLYIRTHRHVHDFKFNLFFSYSLADSWKGTKLSISKIFPNGTMIYSAVYEMVVSILLSLWAVCLNQIFHILRTNFDRINSFQKQRYSSNRVCEEKEEQAKKVRRARRGSRPHLIQCILIESN